METNRPPTSSQPSATESGSKSDPTLDPEDNSASTRPRPSRPVGLIVVLYSVLFFAAAYNVIQITLATLAAHFILAYMTPHNLDPTGAFSTASYTATAGLSLIGTSLALTPYALQAAYVCFIASSGPRRPASARPTTGIRTRWPSAAQAMHALLVASTGPFGSVIYRSAWCPQLDQCDALDPLRALIVTLAGRLLIGGYRLARRRHSSEDVSDELEALAQEQLEMEQGSAQKIAGITEGGGM